MLKYLCTCVLLTALAMQAQLSSGVQKQPARGCAASGTVVNALTGEPIVRAMVSFSGVTSEPRAASDARVGHREPDVRHSHANSDSRRLASRG